MLRFYLKQKQLNPYKLIPWQSNSLYFSKITPEKQILDPFNKIKIFLACNTNKLDLNKRSNKVNNYLSANTEWDLTHFIQPNQKNIFKINK